MNATKKTQDNDIRAKVLIVNLSIKRWQGAITDKDVSTDTIDRYKAIGGINEVGRYVKRLFDKLELKEINNIADGARYYHYNMTMPYTDNGLRMLPSALFMDYDEQMEKHKRSYEAAVNRFLKGYSERVQNQRERLGKMFREGDYPSAATLRNKFQFGIEFMTMPDRTALTDLLGSDDEINKVRERMEQKLHSTMDNAARDIMRRMEEHVEKLIERLQDNPDGTTKQIRDSVIGNIKDICDFAATLNVMNNPDVERVRASIEKSLASLDPETLKTDSKARTKARKEAARIVKDMSGFF